MRCGNLACTGKQFAEHRNIPDLRPDPGTVRHAFLALAEEGLVHIRHGRMTTIAGEPARRRACWLAIDPVTSALIVSYLAEIKAELTAVGAGLRDDAYLFSNDPAHVRPWNPDWVTHRVADAADAAGVGLDIKGGRHCTASQLLAGGFDLRNTAARLRHSGGGATTLRSPRSTGVPPLTSRS